MSDGVDTIEHMFEYEGVTLTPLHPETAPTTSGSSAARVAELQARINGMQAGAPPTRAIPTRADLSTLLPGGLREGTVLQVRHSTSLMAAVAAEASAAGRWTAWVGWAGLNAELLSSVGLRLDRTALIPNPGTHWFAVTAALVDAMSVVIVRPPRGAQVGSGERARLVARLRERGACILVDGDWPGADAELRVDAVHWMGLGAGVGVLQGRQLQVSARDRHGRVRRGQVLVEPLTFDRQSTVTAELECVHADQRVAVNA